MLKFSTLALVSVLALTACQKPGPQLGPDGQPLPVAYKITSREEAIRLLDKICEYFNRHEPSSPVPFLLKRAKKLVTKDFMAILNDLAPGGAEQASLIFGLQNEETGD